MRPGLRCPLGLHEKQSGPYIGADHIRAKTVVEDPVAEMGTNRATDLCGFGRRSVTDGTTVRVQAAAGMTSATHRSLRLLQHRGISISPRGSIPQSNPGSILPS